MHQTLDQCVLRLNLIEGVGPAVIETLIKHNFAHEHTAQGFMSAEEIAHRYHLPIGRAQILADGLRDDAALERELALIEKHHVNWVTCFDDRYPTYLKNIHLPPPILYWQGTLPADETMCLAVVGARKANRYAHETLSTLLPSFIEAGITITSGGAIGADSMAHTITLQNGGKTIAVLGSGLLRPYPDRNSKLFEDMVAHGGALTSSFPLNFPPLSGNFPARNRIIAGLSRGCLVVQAAEKSGALITAQYALENGREVFAIPGPIDDPLSTGCNQLIQQGAQLVQQAADILQVFGLAQEAEQQTIGAKIAHKSKKTDNTTASPLSEQDQQIVHGCRQPCSTDDLLELTGLPFAQLCAMLCTLQLEGHLEQLSNGQWQQHGPIRHY